MNEWKEIIKEYITCIVPISLIYKGEQISYGTGTVFTNSGKIITANHVIDQIENFKDELENIKILVRIEKKGAIHYKPVLSNVTISIPDFANDLLLDVAVLEPIEPFETDYFIKPKLEFEPTDFGESMLIGGYSEESPFVFDYDKIIGKRIPVKDMNRYKIQLGFMKPPTFKSGILSHRESIYLGGEMGLSAEIFHIDNGMHRGGSGGPIINSKGEFVGVITHRAMISLKVLVEKKLMEMYAPSGNTFGIGVSVLKHYEKKIF